MNTASVTTCVDCGNQPGSVETFLAHRICEPCHQRRLNAAAIVGLIEGMADPEETQAFLGLLPTSPPDDPAVLLQQLDHLDVLLAALRVPVAPMTVRAA
jgi:hypothetical protein